MYTKRFLDHSIPDRYRLVMSDKNVEYIYELLSKHLMKTVTELKDIYTIELNTVRQRIFINGSEEDLFELLQYLLQFGLPFESITSNCLRVDITQFLYKIR